VNTLPKNTFRSTPARAETLVACHLSKAVEGWTDLGFGEFERSLPS
jgi:hypothetical protein